MIHEENRITHYLSIYKYQVLFGILCGIYIISRIAFLDSDLPPWIWDVYGYSQMDELFYSITGFNLYLFHSWIPQIVPFIETDSFPNLLIGAVFSFFALEIFGNNYYGLRIAPVLASFLIFILMYLVVKNLMHISRSGRVESLTATSGIILFSVLIYLLSDFSFLLAGRIYEPTIFRMLAMVTVLYFFSLPSLDWLIHDQKFLCFMGFIAGASFFYVYPTNIFIIPAAGIPCLFAGFSRGIKPALYNGFYYGTGLLISVISYEVIIRLFFHKTVIDVITSLMYFSNRTTIVANGTIDILQIILPYANNLLCVWTTGIFRFNPILLSLFIFSLPFFISGIIKRRENSHIAIFSMFFFFMAQSMIINDYPNKKDLILLPLVLIQIAVVAHSYADIFTYPSKKVLIPVFSRIHLIIGAALFITVMLWLLLNTRGILSSYLFPVSIVTNELQNDYFSTFALFFLFVLFLLSVILIIQNIRTSYGSHIIENRSAILLIYCIVCTLIPFLLFFWFTQSSFLFFPRYYLVILLFLLQVMAISSILMKKGIPTRLLYGGIALVLVVPGLFLGYSFIYANQSYTYKDTMMNLSQYTDNEIVIFGYPFRLYGSSIPILDVYLYKISPLGETEGLGRYKNLKDQLIIENRSRYEIYLITDKPDSLMTNLSARNRTLIYPFDLNELDGGKKISWGLFEWK